MRQLFLFFLLMISYSHADEPLQQALEEGNPFNIGNAYFRLEQYPWAILYYARALKENPQNARANEYLHLALEQIPGPKSPPITGAPGHLFLWFLLFLGAATLFGSLSIWRSGLLFKSLFGAFTFIVAGFLISATIIHYFTPIPAVMVKSSPLFQNPSEDAGTVGSAPIFAGSSIDVIEVNPEGTWIKVQTYEGTIGFLPLKSLRII